MTRPYTEDELRWQPNQRGRRASGMVEDLDRNCSEEEIREFMERRKPILQAKLEVLLQRQAEEWMSLSDRERDLYLNYDQNRYRIAKQRQLRK